MKYLFPLVFLLFLPTVVSATVLYPQASQPVTVGQTFTVSCVVDSEGENINVVAGTLLYPTDLLEVLDVAKTDSFLTLWAEEPSVDTKQGTVTFAGGIPNGTVAFRVPAITVTFLAKRPGTATLAMDQEGSAVYVNDGFGTSSAVTVRETTVQVNNPDPLTPRIFSSTHPREERWYAGRDAIFTWETQPTMVTSVLLSRDPDAEPDDVQEDVSGSVSYPSLTDGIWYLSLKQKFLGPDEWGPVGRRTIRIDGTRPELPVLQIMREGGETFAAFSASDALSGIDRYEVRLEKPRYAWFPFFSTGAWVVQSSPMRLGVDPLFESVSVRAIDEAGNEKKAVFANNEYVTHQARFWVFVSVAALTVAIMPMVFTKRRRRKK